MNATFGILSISHKRDKVLELFCTGVQRLRAEMEMFIPCVVVGDEEHYEICSKYSIHHIAQSNHPATRKWNTGVAYLMGLGVDYILILGSDDLCSTDLVKNLYAQMQKGTHLIGINSVHFYSADGEFRGKMRNLSAPKQLLGVARCISKDIIYKVDGVPWNKDSSWGMDAICLRNILQHVKTSALVEGDCYDIKTKESLNRWTFWKGRIPQEENPARFYNILSEDELRLLLQIK